MIPEQCTSCTISCNNGSVNCPAKTLNALGCRTVVDQAGRSYMQCDASCNTVRAACPNVNHSRTVRDLVLNDVPVALSMYDDDNGSWIGYLVTDSTYKTENGCGGSGGAGNRFPRNGGNEDFCNAPQKMFKSTKQWCDEWWCGKGNAGATSYNTMFKDDAPALFQFHMPISFFDSLNRQWSRSRKNDGVVRRGVPVQLFTSWNARPVPNTLISRKTLLDGGIFVQHPSVIEHRDDRVASLCYSINDYRRKSNAVQTCEPENSYWVLESLDRGTEGDAALMISESFVIKAHPSSEGSYLRWNREAGNFDLVYSRKRATIFRVEGEEQRASGLGNSNFAPQCAFLSQKSEACFVPSDALGWQNSDDQEFKKAMMLAQAVALQEQKQQQQAKQQKIKTVALAAGGTGAAVLVLVLIAVIVAALVRMQKRKFAMRSRYFGF